MAQAFCADAAPSSRDRVAEAFAQRAVPATLSWPDTHGAFLNLNNERKDAIGHVILCLAVLPTLAMVIGFFQAVDSLLRREWDHPYFILVGTTCLTVFGVLSFSLEVPTGSVTRASFFLSLLAPLGVFAGLGLETLLRWLKTLRWLLYVNLAVLYGMILGVFWYRGT